MSARTTALAEPARPSLWAAIVYGLAVMTLAYPALAGQFLVNPRSDQYIAGYGFREFAAQSLKAGEGFPQWSPYLFGGMPYIAGMHGDIFYPTFLLRMVLPTDVAMTWGFIIHVFLAGFFTYGFLRAWGIGFHGALIGGLAYMLSGPIAAYVSPGHDGKLFVSALLPLTLWLLVRGVRDGRMWAWGGLALTIGLAVLSPHPQLLQYLLLTAGAFTLYLCFADHPGAGRIDRRVAMRRLGLAAAAVVVGAAIGAIQYLPVAGYVDWSPRAGGKGWEHAISYSMPTEELLNAFVPQFSGVLDGYWGRNGIHLHSEYAGVVVLILAGLGMFARNVSRSFRIFWLATFAVSLLWTLGGSTPFYRLIYAIVPGTKFFRAPSTMMFVTMFSLAVFAGIGAQRLLQSASDIPRRFLYAWAGATVLLGALMVSGLATIVADSIASSMAAAGYPPDSTVRVSEGARANQGNVLIGVARSLLFVFAALGLVWAAARQRIAGLRLAAAIAGLVTIDLWTVEKSYWQFSPSARQLFASDPAIDSVRASPNTGRVLFVDLMQSAATRDPMFYGSAPMAVEVRAVTGYHGNELGRYQELMRISSGGLSQAFWRHGNVRWLYTTAPDSLMPAVAAQLQYTGAFEKVVGPVTNASGSTVYLYRVPGDNPTAWVASTMVKGNDEQALATVLDGRFEPGRAAIVDTGAAVQTADLAAVPAASPIAATTTRYEPGEIDVALNAPAVAGNALVVSENFYPGWRAVVDGREVEPVRANFNLIGVPLPQGAREVRLTFSDPAYRSGRLVTLMALLLSLAAIVAGVIASRRSAPTPAHAHG